MTWTGIEDDWVPLLILQQPEPEVEIVVEEEPELSLRLRDWLRLVEERSNGGT